MLGPACDVHADPLRAGGAGADVSVKGRRNKKKLLAGFYKKISESEVEASKNIDINDVVDSCYEDAARLRSTPQRVDDSVIGGDAADTEIPGVGQWWTTATGYAQYTAGAYPLYFLALGLLIAAACSDMRRGLTQTRTYTKRAVSTAVSWAWGDGDDDVNELTKFFCGGAESVIYTCWTSFYIMLLVITHACCLVWAQTWTNCTSAVVCGAAAVHGNWRRLAARMTAMCGLAMGTLRGWCGWGVTAPPDTGNESDGNGAGVCPPHASGVVIGDMRCDTCWLLAAWVLTVMEAVMWVGLGPTIATLLGLYPFVASGRRQGGADESPVMGLSAVFGDSRYSTMTASCLG